MIGLWISDRPTAAVARRLLRPASVLYGTGCRLRRYAFEAGWRQRRQLPLPSVGVGSLQVGGAGKTPVAAWAAAWLAAHGVRPGILLRGYGGDEGALHRAAVPMATVVEDPDRQRAARIARRAGAQALVLDDNAQHLPVSVDRQILLFGVEALAGPRDLLPAGPWREPFHAGRADLIVLTRKTASDDALAAARAVLRSVYPDVPIAALRLGIAGWHGPTGDAPFSDAALAGRRLLAVSGIADPRPFLTHVGAIGDLCAHRTFRDHAAYPPRRVRGLVRAAESARVDYVVTTAKDAVKLRSVWPPGAPPLLVSDLTITWDEGEALMARVLAECLPGRRLRARPEHAAVDTAAGTA